MAITKWSIDEGRLPSCVSNESFTKELEGGGVRPGVPAASTIGAVPNYDTFFVRLQQSSSAPSGTTPLVTCPARMAGLFLWDISAALRLHVCGEAARVGRADEVIK